MRGENERPNRRRPRATNAARLARFVDNGMTDLRMNRRRKALTSCER